MKNLNVNQYNTNNMTQQGELRQHKIEEKDSFAVIKNCSHLCSLRSKAWDEDHAVFHAIGQGNNLVKYVMSS